VGWYHSHPGYGIFMSNVDISTQTRLQQFSQYVTAMIIDPSTDQVGFFTLDTSGSPQSIRPEYVRFFAEGEQPVPPEFEAPIEQAPPSPPWEEIEAPVPAPRRRKTGRNLVIALLLVGIALGGAFLTVFLLPDRTPLTVEPIEPKAWYGNPVAFEVTVKGSPGRLFPVRVENVTLHYRLVRETDFRTRQMSQLRVEQPLVWTCTVPGEYVTGDMRYYFSALTALKVETKTVEYTLHVADFSLNISPKEQQLPAGKNGKFAVTITPLWHFASSKVTLSAQATSGDFSFRWSPNDLTVLRDKRAETSLDIEVKPNSYGNHTITVTAKSENVTHLDYFRIVVPDFKVSARPTDILNADRRTVPTVTFILAFESLWGDIGNLTGWDLEATELPPGVSYGRNVSSVIVRKNKAEYVSFSFSVSPSTPSGQYAIVLTAYAVDSPTCRKQLRLTLKIT